MNTGREDYKGTIPQHKVIYLRHTANKLQVNFNYQLVEETDEEGLTLQNLQFDYVQVPDLTGQLLADAGVPEPVIDAIMLFNGTHTWHEELPIQIVFTIAAMKHFLQDYPQIASYTVLQYLNYYVENGHVYIYAGFLLPEHDQLIRSFGGVITNETSN